MAETVLTRKQQEQIRQRAVDVEAWRDEQDLNRRRGIATELRHVMQNSGILSGQTLDHKTLCELLALQWQIQNLNPL
jgi:hypothetical protein